LRWREKRGKIEEEDWRDPATGSSTAAAASSREGRATVGERSLVGRARWKPERKEKTESFSFT
jgi:hypothetical protein